MGAGKGKSFLFAVTDLFFARGRFGEAWRRATLWDVGLNRPERSASCWLAYGQAIFLATVRCLVSAGGGRWPEKNPETAEFQEFEFFARGIRPRLVVLSSRARVFIIAS
jgi:hypothetical protein